VTVNLANLAAQNTGGAGIDTLSGIENLSGSAFNDTLSGSTLANVIAGGAGLDTIAGGLGNDVLQGGTGSDIFRFDSLLNAATNVDTISDFAVPDDTLQLSGSIFSGIAAGTLGASAFQLGTAANDAGDRIVYDSATGNIYYDANGNGAGAQTLFARVAAGTALTNLDFSVTAAAAAPVTKTPVQEARPGALVEGETATPSPAHANLVAFNGMSFAHEADYLLS
ncbi:MAG: calcium-binding protein, partial [Sphingomicrobium sp.]